MAHDYPLEELSPRAFEQLTVALASEVIGSGVEAFGAGPDGGREATYDGPIEWSATTGFGVDSWNGYTVIQAKQRDRVYPPQSNIKWLSDRINDELAAWENASSKRGRTPKYIIFVTNVALGSVPETGGIDKINAYVQARIRHNIDGNPRDSLVARGVTDVKVWHRDQVNGLLTKYDGIRHAFKGLLTVGDLLSRLGTLGGLLEPDLFQPVLTKHAMTTLANERWVNFRDAGDPGASARASVEEVVIDLKVEAATDQAETFLAEAISRADQVMRRSYNSAPRHIVLTGQPGSGKSTVTQFLNQLYRVYFSAEEAQTETAKEVSSGTRESLKRLNLDEPRNKRWPIRISLPDYADRLGPSGDTTLMRWLTEKITARAEIDIKPHTLNRWIQHWPTLVILDGLDEVTAPEVRPRVLDEIQNFIEHADMEDADLLVIVTTRPTGEAERFMPDRFSQINLSYLDAESAIEYGRHITNRRLSDDADTREQLIARFEREAGNAAMLRLMKTPLQVLIITLILEALGTLPSDRYQLFSRYFDTIYQREQAKNTSLTPLLSNHKPAIAHLHESVGLELQIQSETTTDARAVLPKTDLWNLAFARLVELGNPPDGDTKRIATQIVQAATERLVLLVPGIDDGITFEIRSLQELMAARALSNSTDEVVRRRLALAAPSPHWRNTWTFLAGRMFAEGADHRRDMVLEVVEQADRADGWPGWLLPITAELAASLLDDGMAAAYPKWQARLLELALGSIKGPAPLNLSAIARGLTEVANTAANLTSIRDAIRAGLDGTPREQELARRLQDAGRFGQQIKPAWRSELRPLSETRVTRKPIADELEPTIVDLGLEGEARSLLDALLVELRGFGTTDEWDPTRLALRMVLPTQLPATHAALDDFDAAAALELAFSTLGPERWTASAALALLVGGPIVRTPVGERLRGSS